MMRPHTGQFLKRVWLSALYGACVGIAPCAFAADWSEFRGPTGQGHVSATGLPLEWSDTENVVWQTPIPGLGWSSPICNQGNVYLTTAVPGENGGTDQSLRALCVDAAHGKVLWDVEVFQQSGTETDGIHSKNSHASPTPITDGRHLFVHFGTNGTACLTLKGEIVWTNRSLKYDPVHGNGGSPVLHEDMLIVLCDGGDVDFVVALDKATGQIRWKTDREADGVRKKFSFATPLVIEAGGRTQVVCPGSGFVAAYEPETGKEIWRAEYPGGYSVIPRPVFGNGLVYICTGYNSPSLLAVRPDGTGNVTDTHIVWRSDSAGWKARGAVPHTPSLMLVGTDLFFVSDKGIASCVDALTGKAFWQERLGGSFSASPVLAEGRVYFQSEQGETIVIRAGREFEVLARNHVQERTLASPAVTDSALLLRTEARLMRIER